MLSRSSLRSHRSLLSIGSVGSVLSIGSVGSFASMGSIGSAMSMLSAGSYQSRASVLSGQSDGSILSWQSSRAFRGRRDSGRLGGELLDHVAALRSRLRSSRRWVGGGPGNVGLGECLEPIDPDRCLPGLERALHEAEVDRADDPGAGLRELQERTAPQLDPARPTGLVRCEPQPVQHPEHPSARRARRTQGCPLRGDPASPASPDLGRAAARLGV